MHFLTVHFAPSHPMPFSHCVFKKCSTTPKKCFQFANMCKLIKIVSRARKSFSCGHIAEPTPLSNTFHTCFIISNIFFLLFQKPSSFVLEQINVFSSDLQRVAHAQATTLQRRCQSHIRHPIDSVKVIISLSIFHIINRNLTISSRQFEDFRRDLFPANTRFQYLGQFNYKLFG